ncbi:MAG: MerR family transcriptional regulator [bacterium]
MDLNWPEQLEEDKLYYSIGDVADALDLQQSTLRYWEDEFSVLNPDSSPGGQRRYRQEDVKTVMRVRYLLREEKFKIEGAQQKLKEWDSFESTVKTAKSIRQICDDSISRINQFVESL